MRNLYADKKIVKKQTHRILFLIIFLSTFLPRHSWAIPNPPSNLAATAISLSQINLSWDDNSANETGFSLERATASDGPYSVIKTLGASVTSFSNTGLTYNTTYYYRVRAYDKTGNSAYTNVASATAVPRAPSNLTVTVFSPSQINLAWVDNSTDEASFVIERKAPNSKNPDPPYIQIASVGANNTNYPNTGLSQNTTYFYRVKACYKDACSQYSNEASATIITITASAGQGGTISPSGVLLINKGASQTFMITPNTGYSITDVVVDTAQHLGAVTTYPFTNVTGSHTIAANFADVIPPTGSVVINIGATATNNTSVTLTLSATDSGSGVSQMQFSNDSATWSAPEPYTTTKAWTLDPGEGTKTVYVKFTDNAGNSFTAMASINLYSLTISNVTASSNAINTYNSESSTIFFTIDGPATVTLKIVPEKQGPSGSPIYQTSQAIAAAGSSSFTWDGKDNTGKVVPDEAYLYILEASDGTRADSYSPPAPTGTSGVTCSKSAYNVYKNEPMTISYSVSQPERVDISISWGGQNFKIMNAVPHVSGNYTFDWDGRNSSGKIMAEGAVSTCAVASLLRENAIITSGDTPSVSRLKTDPYRMVLSYGQFTRMSYTLARDSIVTIKLISPSGVAVTVVSNAVQSAGANELQWNAVDATDATGRNLLITEDGDYLVSVQAVNPTTGTSATARGCLKIWQ